MILVAASLSPAYAPIPTMTLNISANPALPNQVVTFSGQISPPNGASDLVSVNFYTGAGCVNANSYNFVSGNANSGGSYSFTAGGGAGFFFSIGTYSTQAVDESYTPNVLSPCDPFTVAPAAVGGYLQPINTTEVLSAMLVQGASGYWWLLAIAVVVAAVVVLIRRRS